MTAAFIVNIAHPNLTVKFRVKKIIKVFLFVGQKCTKKIKQRSTQSQTLNTQVNRSTQKDLDPTIYFNGPNFGQDVNSPPPELIASNLRRAFSAS